MKQQTQKVSTCLWYDNNVAEALDFYESVFEENFKRGDVLLWGDLGPGPKGTILTAVFYIHGQEFMALNGGPQFKFNEAASIIVNCDTQAEIDELWEKLSAGGQKSMCGWLKDKFGLSWQIVPPQIIELFRDKNEKKANAAMGAMMQMSKLDIQQIRAAYDAA